MFYHAQSMWGIFTLSLQLNTALFVCMHEGEDAHMCVWMSEVNEKYLKCSSFFFSFFFLSQDLLMYPKLAAI